MPENTEIVPHLLTEGVRVEEAKKILAMNASDGAQYIERVYGSNDRYFRLISQEVCIQALLNPDLGVKAMIIDMTLDRIHIGS